MSMASEKRQLGRPTRKASAIRGMFCAGRRETWEIVGERSKHAGKLVARAETEGGVRRRIRRAGEKSAGEIREERSRGRQTYLLARVSPALLGEAAVVEPLPEAKAPPSPPIFPIRARSTHQRVDVSPLVSSSRPPSARGAATGGLLFPHCLFGPPSPPPVFSRAGSRLLQSSLDQIK